MITQFCYSSREIPVIVYCKIVMILLQVAGYGGWQHGQTNHHPIYSISRGSMILLDGYMVGTRNNFFFIIFSSTLVFIEGKTCPFITIFIPERAFRSKPITQSITLLLRNKHFNTVIRSAVLFVL
ncbi:hypothetical protein C2G38_2109869 [Gigaspora rosea]|uniref:Uncharacterized protein n=1 Tax=Gigaspora rosea TaxID=44941 RepID=A0A397UIK5_9GLOM|nr:hypothetical protein C2G38_2109869 [Gigaspora rosea]